MEGFNPVNKVNSKVKKIIPIVAVIIVIAIIASFSIVIVPAGSTGVVMTLGKVSDNVMQEGLHFKVPFVQNVAIISNKIQKQEVQANAVSKDLQTVESEIAGGGGESRWRLLGEILRGRDWQTRHSHLPDVRHRLRDHADKITT